MIKHTNKNNLNETVDFCQRNEVSHGEEDMAAGSNVVSGAEGWLVIVSTLRKQRVNSKWSWGIKPQGQLPVTHFLQ